MANKGDIELELGLDAKGADRDVDAVASAISKATQQAAKLEAQFNRVGAALKQMAALSKDLGRISRVFSTPSFAAIVNNATVTRHRLEGTGGSDVNGLLRQGNQATLAARAFRGLSDAFVQVAAGQKSVLSVSTQARKALLETGYSADELKKKLASLTDAQKFALQQGARAFPGQLRKVSVTSALGYISENDAKAAAERDAMRVKAQAKQQQRLLDQVHADALKEDRRRTREIEDSRVSMQKAYAENEKRRLQAETQRMRASKNLAFGQGGNAAFIDTLIDRSGTGQRQALTDFYRKQDEASLRAAQRQEQTAQRRLAAEQRAQDALRRQQEREDPSGDKARQRRDQVLFGDGGASLLRVQGALLLHYKLLNSIAQSYGFLSGYVVDFDKNLRQLQAIVDITNTEMLVLGNSLIKVSQETAFSANEITKAAVTLGQAGFSAKEITDAIGAIAKFSVGAGIPLQQGVELASNALATFNLQARETGSVMDVMTAALNNTKLDVEKMSLGLQYAGAIAHQNNVTFEELTVSLAALANSGVRSASTIGTGLRQLFIELLDPTEKFKEELRKVGLTTEDVNVKTKGFEGALKTLRDAGFNSAAAIRSFETRSASAFSALIGQLDTFRDVEEGIRLSGTAAKANETQMNSFSNTFKQLANNAGNVAVILSGPILDGFQKIGKVINSGLVAIQDYSTALQVVGTIGGALLAGGTLVFFTRLAIGGVQALGAMTGLVAAFQKFATISAFMGAGTAISAIPMLINPMVALTAAVVAGAAAFALLHKNAETTAQKLDKVQALIDKTKASFDATKGAITVVDSEIQRLVGRMGTFTDEDLQREIGQVSDRMAEFGLSINEPINNMTDLINVMIRFKAELANRFEFNISDFNAKAKLLSQSIGERTGLNAVKDVIRNSETLMGMGAARGLQRRYNMPGVTGFTAPGNLPTPIANALNFIGTQQKVDTNNRDDNDRLITEIRKLVADLNAIPESSGKAFTAARDLTEALKVIAGQAQSANVNLTQRESAVRLEGTKTFEAGLGSNINSVIADATGKLNVRTREIARQQSSERRLFEARQEQKIAEEVSKNAIGDLDSAVAAGTANQSDTKHIRQVITDYMAQVNSLVDKYEKEFNKDRIKILDKQIAELTAEIKTSAQTTDQTNLDTLVSKRRQLNALYDKKRDTARELASRQADKDKVKADEKEALIREATAKVDEEREQALTRLGETLQNLMTSYTELIKKIDDDTKDFLRDVRRGSKEMDAQTKARVKNATAPGEVQQKRVEALQSSQNFNYVSEADLYFENKRLRELKLKGLYETSVAKDDQARDATARINQVQEVIRQREKLKQELESSIKTDAGGTGSEERLKVNREELARVEEDLKTARDELTQQTNRLTEAEQAAAEAMDKYREGTYDASQETNTLIDSLRRSTEAWLETSGAFSSKNKVAAESMTSALSATRDAMRGLISDTTKGTKTMGEAFKDFALRVIESMIDIQAQAVASGIMGFLGKIVLSALGSSMSGATTTGVDTTGDGGAGFSYTTFGGPRVRGGLINRKVQGGFVRRAMGGNPNRDSQLILAQPGEYMVRKSAVDFIGRDTLDTINAMGNRSVHNSGIKPMPSHNQSSKNGIDAVNVWIVSPDQVPPPSPRDIITTVQQNMSQGGVLKKMVKSISMGQI